MFWDGGLVLPLHCQLFSKKVQRVQEVAKSSKAVLHVLWKRCQLNKTERPQLCMISITLPAETTHLTWPENTWTTFQYICHKKTLCRFNTTRQINTARYQTPGYFKCAHIYQPGCVVCTLFANTTLYTLSYIVHRLTSGCMKVFPSVTVRKMVTGGGEILFSELIQGSGRRDKQKFIEYRISQGFC